MTSRTDMTIEFDKVTKSYGPQKVLDGACFTVPRGQVVALLGENGAGKTTTIRSLMGFLKPDSGEVRAFGLNVQKHTDDVRRRIGYVSDQPALYDWMNVAEMGWFCAAFYDAEFGDRFETIVTGFDVPLKQRIGKLSRGQKARVALSLALAQEPELLLMDEPTSGLDPIVRREFLQKIREFSHQDRAVLLASHQVEDVERVADAVAILQPNGQYLAAPLTELKLRIRELSFETGEVTPTVDDEFVLSATDKDSRRTLIVKDLPEAQLEQLRESTTAAGWQERELTLEEIYLAILRGNAVAAVS